MVANKVLRVELCRVQTDLGWMAIAGMQGKLAKLWFGFTESNEIDNVAAEWSARTGLTLTETNWQPALVKSLKAYAAGEVVDFSRTACADRELTPFAQRVVAATRAIPYGCVVTYGELAQRVGHPGAARAVGSVMSSNPIPLIIPCHRVVGSGGRLCGFSAPTGINLKRRLLELEQGQWLAQTAKPRARQAELNLV